MSLCRNARRPSSEFWVGNCPLCPPSSAAHAPAAERSGSGPDRGGPGRTVLWCHVRQVCHADVTWFVQDWGGASKGQSPIGGCHGAGRSRSVFFRRGRPDRTGRTCWIIYQRLSSWAGDAYSMNAVWIAYINKVATLVRIRHQPGRYVATGVYRLVDCPVFQRQRT